MLFFGVITAKMCKGPWDIGRHLVPEISELLQEEIA